MVDGLNLDFYTYLQDSTNLKLQTIWSSNSKTSGYKYRDKDESLFNYKFVKLNTSLFTNAFTIDIDNSKDVGKVLESINFYKLPLPNSIVETNRGLQVHYILETAISNKNYKAYAYVMEVARNLTYLLGGDLAAVNSMKRIVRNPCVNCRFLQLDSKVKCLDEFTELINDKAVRNSYYLEHVFNNDMDKFLEFSSSKEESDNTPKSKSIEWYELNIQKLVQQTYQIQQGGRNNHLFTVLSKRGIYLKKKNPKISKELLQIDLQDMSKRVNGMLEYPLKASEISSIEKSVVTWVMTRYKPTKCYTEHNRRINRDKSIKHFKIFLKELYEAEGLEVFTTSKYKRLKKAYLNSITSCSRSTFYKYIKTVEQSLTKLFLDFLLKIEHNNSITAPVLRIQKEISPYRFLYSMSDMYTGECVDLYFDFITGRYGLWKE